jgi:hypothetical protein
MRIYNRTDFMKLPEGVLFCKGKPWHWGDLSVKGESLVTDFTDRGLCWIESNSSEDAIDRMERMLTEGTSEPMQTAYGRDGCFDNEDLFLVFEETDLMELIAIAQTGIVALRRAEKKDSPNAQ